MKILAIFTLVVASALANNYGYAEKTAIRIEAATTLAPIRSYSPPAPMPPPVRLSYAAPAPLPVRQAYVAPAPAPVVKQAYVAPVVRQSYVAPAPAPIVRQAYVAPVVKQSYVAPAPAPVVKQAYVAPVVKQAYVAPVVKQAYVAPVVKQAYVAPVVKQAYVAPVVKQAYVAPVVKQAYVAPVVKQAYVAPAPAPIVRQAYVAPAPAPIVRQAYVAPVVKQSYVAPAPAPVVRQAYVAPAPAPVIRQSYAAPAYQAPAPIATVAPVAYGSYGGYSAMESPSAIRSEVVPILKHVHDSDHKGTYNLEVHTGDGIKHSESGSLKDLKSPEGLTGVKKGQYSYTGPEGKLIKVDWSADEHGFKAQGDHLPTPHPIPEEIKKGLALPRIPEFQPKPEENEHAAPLKSQSYDSYAPMKEAVAPMQSYGSYQQVRLPPPPPPPKIAPIPVRSTY